MLGVYQLSKAFIIVNRIKLLLLAPGDTALIETNETVWVSKKITGTYHSRVTQVSQGTGHIGTTLDPNYIGPSLISLPNHSIHPVELIPKTTNFVTLAFQYLHTESSREHGNTHGRRDILGEVGIQTNREESNALDKPYMSNKDLLLLKLEECKDYQSIKSERERRANQNNTEVQNKNKKILSLKLYAAFIGLILVLGLLTQYLQANQKQLGQKNWYAGTNYTINALMIVIPSALTALITVDLNRKI
ncbi:MAG: deoxycytidine triphosphate deaminase [Nostoc sp.]|uniref:deoxycytidine triphosphate deaminase n=1 Tax=Nostoc sp. TaxID=1180 RepID=UPI002FFC7070